MSVWDSFNSFLDYECLLSHSDWLGSNLRVGHFFSFRCPLVHTPQLNTQLSYERILVYEWRLNWTELNWTELNWSVNLSLSLILRPTVCLGIKHPYGAYDQIFITVRQLRVCWCGALSLTRRRVCRLQFLLVLASAVIFWVRVPWDSWPYFTVSDSRLPFSLPPTTRRATVEELDPTSTRERTELLNELPFISWCGPERKHPLERFVCCIRLLHQLSWEGVSLPQQPTCLAKRS
jgi:hypothetical protein